MGALRIVGGTLSGRRFGGKVRDGTRPTSDRVREAIASVIEARGGFVGSRVLDLFAGTGALSFEALSRGAERALLIDRESAAVRDIVSSAASLGLSGQARAIAMDLASAERAVPRIAALDEGPFDRVFVDPPYQDVGCVPALLDGLAAAGVLAPSALVVVEHGTKASVDLGDRLATPPASVRARSGHPRARSAPRALELQLGSPFDVVSRYRYGDTSVLLARWEPPSTPSERSPR